MTASILDGKALAARLREEVAQEVSEIRQRGGRPPGLAAVLVGDDPASAIYVRNKTKACEEVGMVGRTVSLDAGIEATELESVVAQLNNDPEIDGFLIQLPLPSGLPVAQLQQLVSPRKDVDGLHPQNAGKLWLGRRTFVPATPRGVIELLKRSEIPLEGKHAVIVGRSNIVGKPMAALLLRENCTVEICHSRTADLAAECRRADLLIAAVGVPGLITRDHVKEGAVVIDVGMNRVSDPETFGRLFAGRPKKERAFSKRGSVLCGDVDYERVAQKASAITPVPGGVGPLTIALLLRNTLDAYLWHHEGHSSSA